MRAVLLDAGRPATCFPITGTRPLAACPVANRPLRDIQCERLRRAGFKTGAGEPAKTTLFVRGDAWLSESDLARLARASDPAVLRDAEGAALAWLGAKARPAGGEVLRADADSFLVRYPWDLLRVNECVLGRMARSRIDGKISSAAHVTGFLALGADSRILPGVCIDGRVVIGRDCVIGPNCFIRGATSIGDGCHIGHAVEIKNSLIMRGTSIGHLSYCGDSVIGEDVNFGAGTITANFRHDGAAHRSPVGRVMIDTGRRKLGAIVGDGVHTGIHTGIYPGRKLWPGVSTLPGAIVRRDLKRS